MKLKALVQAEKKALSISDIDVTVEAVGPVSGRNS